MSAKDAFYYSAGIGFLALAKAKSMLHGYRTPAEFDSADTERCDEHSRNNMRQLLQRLEQLWPGKLKGAHVLELGPGSSLAGCELAVMSGAAGATALDRFRLAPERPLVRYVVREDFDPTGEIEPASIDVVFSTAAFEHFDDVPGVARWLTRIVRPGGVIVAEIDLQTHSRWIREVDPNNIYRYPEWLYRTFRFPGQPNRMRPADYVDAFRRCGWTDMHFARSNHCQPRGTVHRRFRDGYLDHLSILLSGVNGSRGQH